MLLVMEKNNQGKTDRQTQDSEFIMAVGLVGLIGCILLGLIAKFFM